MIHPELAVAGYRDLMRALKKAEKETRLGVRREIRRFAEPVQMTAQTLALERIPNMSASPKWAGMRIGITQKLVYVAPRQKGTRGRGRRGRPNLGDLLMYRAMQPALERYRPQVEAGFEQFLDRIADDFNH